MMARPAVSLPHSVQVHPEQARGRRSRAWWARLATARATRLPFALIVLATISVVGCRTIPTAAPLPSQPWEVRRSALQADDRFDMDGRIAVAAAKEGFNARLRWQQQGARSQLALDGPLGMGGVRITADGPALNIVNSRGERLDSDAARRDIAAKLGFEPPFDSLRYWVLGVPNPSHPADEVLDDQQRLATLRQDGWLIEYGGYSTVGGQWLPVRMTLKRDDIRLKLVVDKWGS